MEEMSDEICYLKAPCNIVIAGSTLSGKSYLTFKLIKDWPVNLPRASITVLYSAWQDLYEDFIKAFTDISFYQGLQIDKINSLSSEPGKVHVVVIDDLMDAALKSEDFSKLITVATHHVGLVLIFITQNLYLQKGLGTTINRNTQYIFLLKTPHLNTVDVLGRQLYGGSSPLKAAFMNAMNERKYNYLLIDVFSDDIKNRLRSNILSEEKPMIIWRPH